MYKKGNGIRRVLALSLSIIMAMALAMPAFAAQDAPPVGASDIYINGGVGKSYAAYPMLGLTTSLKTPDCHPDGEHIMEGEDTCYNYSYYAYDESLEYFTGVISEVRGPAVPVSDDAVEPMSSDEIVAAIFAMTDTERRQMADLIAKDLFAGGSEPPYHSEYNEAEDRHEFRALPQGYYIIYATSTTISEGAYTLAIMDTAGRQTVELEPKEGIPTITKKILVADEEAEDGYRRVDTTDIGWGDEVMYELVITWPENIQNNDNYVFWLLNQDDNMEFLRIEMIETDGNNCRQDMVDIINNGLSEENPDSRTAYASCPLHGSWAATMSQRTPEGTGFYYGDCAHNFNNVTKDSKTVVWYSSQLKEGYTTASTGNKGAVVMMYNADPYTEMGKIWQRNEPQTPANVWSWVNDALSSDTTTDSGAYAIPDYTAVFTYKATVDKVDASKAPLTGANFVLYRWTGDSYEEAKASDDFTGPGKNAGDRWWSYRTHDIHGADEAALTVGSEGSTFNFKALDSGIYRLVETVVPDGYYKAEDIIFEVVGDYDATFEGLAAAPKLKSLSVKIDGTVVSTGDPDASFSINLPEGTLSTQVINSSGLRLPSTGGAGVTALYIAGLAGVAVAIFGLTRRAPKKEEQ